MTQCNNISFKPSWNPKESVHLTVEQWISINNLTLALNNALKAAVESFPADQGVIYINYDSQFEGPHFCDHEEPNPNDEDT